jgi:hypothetical protein
VAGHRRGAHCPPGGGAKPRRGVGLLG